jgi:glutathione synthase/RimK-type ligase-like ATP-grasp enzyme
MILLWGLPGDTPLAQVHGALKRLGQRVVFFDQRDVLSSNLDISFDGEVTGTLNIADKWLELEEISAIYMRLYSTEQLPGLRDLDATDTAVVHANAILEALTTWTELTPSLVINRISSMESNGSKPYQLRIIERHGFQIPETLITTDAEAVYRFWEKHGVVIYKSIGGVRSIVSRLADEHKGRLQHVQWCPTQFQEYIAGIDYRVHVVGDEIFTVEIRSTADDYRYARRQGGDTELRSCVLPTEISDQCRSMTYALGLKISGIDLRQSTDGFWYCFEVNPSPAFSYFQEATDQPIDLAIARLLMEGESSAKRE